MPTVPRYSDPQVDLQPVAGVRQNAEDQLGPARQLAGLSQALGKTADVASDIGRKMHERTVATELFGGESKAQDDGRAFETDALSTEGVNAWGIHDKGKQFWDDLERKVGDGLTSPDAKRLWAQSAARMRDASLDRLARHEAAQRRQGLEDSTNASIVGLTNAAATDPTPENIGKQREQILKRRQVLADLNGEDTEVRKVKDAEAVSNLHAQVLDGLVERNPTEASRYLKENGKEIDPRKLPTIERAVRQGTLKTVAQEAADAAEMGGMTEVEALAHARKKYEGDEEAAAVTEIKTRFAEKSALREKDQKDAADQAYGIIGRGGKLSDVPARTLARMDGKVLLELQREASGEKAITDWNRYAELRDMARNDPASFRTLDLRKDFGRLAPAQRESLLDLQAADGKKAATAESLDKQIGAALEGIKLSKDFDAQARWQIAHQVALEDATGDVEKRQKIIDRMLVNGEVLSGHWYRNDPNRRYFQVAPEDRPRFEADIPDADRTTIVRWFKDTKGRVPTDYEVEQKYKQAMGFK